MPWLHATARRHCGRVWMNSPTILTWRTWPPVPPRMRAQYVQFTAWHANMNALYPSKVLQRRLPGHCSRRDVIADLIRAVRAKNIRLILYIHPSDGHDFSRADQDRVGWNDRRLMSAGMIS